MTEVQQLNFKGVLIDFGDTLAYIDKSGNREYHEALLSIVRNVGYQGDLQKLTEAFNDVIWNSMKGEFKDFEEFWKRFVKNLDIPMKSNIIENFENVRAIHSSTVFKLYNGALSVLAELQNKYRLALVSNCAIGTFDVIQALGLESFFECIILSYEVGERKPHRKMYFEALRCLALEPDGCIFVADEISDLEGAREVGMKTLLVRQGIHTFKDAKNPDFQPNFQSNNIAEITRFL